MKRASILSTIVLLIWQGNLLGGAEPNSTINQVDSTLRSEKSVFEETLKRAVAGDAIAQFNLGLIYHQGQGVEQDFKEALKWYTKAAEQGYADAQCNLGNMYFFGQGIEQDYKEALKWHTKAADQGLADAQFNLGNMYFFGQGIEQDYKEALKWLTKAADQGIALAQNNLGVIYYQGQGVEQDYKEALKWHTKAAEQGVAIAQYTLGQMYSLGQGVEQDFKEALKWYTKAAEQGYTDAQFKLGVIYYQGQGVDQDYKEALKWYTKASDQGLADAQFNLGMMYYRGQGVEQDYKEALKWYTKAAEQGDADAQFVLGAMYSLGQGVEQDYKEALKWFTKSAEQGFAGAQFDLGWMYAIGQGVIEDYVEGYKWLLLAGMNGKEDVLEFKAFLKKQMTPEQIATAQEKAKEYSQRHQKTIEKDHPQVAGGTGFFISADGFFMTAAHILEGTVRERIICQGKTFSVSRVLVDKNLDLAVLKVVGAGPFSCLPVANSAGVKLGDTVFTVGFPLAGVQGLQPKYTEGTISALSGIGDDPKIFQVSVPVQPGNSGGPLLDSNGQVIGIIVSRLDDISTLLATGSIPQNVNYALKASFIISLLESVPDIVKNLEKPKAMNKSEAIEQAKQAVGMVVVEQISIYDLGIPLEEFAH